MKIDLIMKNFDFEIVHEYMTQEDWKWTTFCCDNTVPSKDNLKQMALHLLAFPNTSSGGFHTSKNSLEFCTKDGETLTSCTVDINHDKKYKKIKSFSDRDLIKQYMKFNQEFYGKPFLVKKNFMNSGISYVKNTVLVVKDDGVAFSTTCFNENERKENSVFNFDVETIPYGSLELI